LVDLSTDAFRGRRLLEIARGQLGIVDLITVLLVRSAATVQAIIAEEQRGIDSQLRDQIELAAPHHLQGIVVAESAVEHDVADAQGCPQHLLDRLQQGQDEAQVRREFDRGLVAILAALGAAGPPLCRWRHRGGRGFGWRVGAQHLPNAQGMGRALLDVHQGEGEKGQPRYGFAEQRRKEAIQAMRFITRLGDDDLVTGQKIGRLRLEQLRFDQQPVHLTPVHHRVEETLHSAVAAARLGPAGDAPHRYPAGHRQHGPNDVAELPPRSRR